jgi:hypothetical protein
VPRELANVAIGEIDETRPVSEDGFVTMRISVFDYFTRPRDDRPHPYKPGAIVRIGGKVGHAFERRDLHRESRFSTRCIGSRLAVDLKWPVLRSNHARLFSCSVSHHEISHASMQPYAVFN